MTSQKNPLRSGLKGNRVNLSFVRRGPEVLTVIQADGGTQRLTLDEADLAELRQLLHQVARPGDEANLIEGKLITGVRPITASELAEFYWFTGCPVLELDDGATLYAAQDEEGNGPGCFWLKAPDGRVFSLQLNDGESETDPT